MTVSLAVGVIFILFCLFILFIRQKRVTKVDGCTIRFFGMREEAVIEYTEPPGRTLIFDAYWQSQKKGKKVILAVEFPADLSVPKVDQLRKQEALERLDIPDTPSIQIQFSAIERDEIKRRVSWGLNQLKITHTFARPQRFGWTNFEDGKEIYHG